MSQILVETSGLQNLIILLGVLFIIMYLMAHSGNGNQTTATKPQNQASKNKREKILKTLEREEIALEGMMIKAEEIEVEIHSLKYDITSGFEEEKKNEMDIRKNELSLKQAKMKIEERRENIEKLKKELGETC